jgi:hypothetical protein
MLYSVVLEHFGVVKFDHHHHHHHHHHHSSSGGGGGGREASDNCRKVNEFFK